jgi:hypothetical protein
VLKQGKGAHNLAGWFGRIGEDDKGDVWRTIRMFACLGGIWFELYILAHEVQINLLSHLFEHLIVTT